MIKCLSKFGSGGRIGTPDTRIMIPPRALPGYVISSRGLFYKIRNWFF